MAIIKAIDLFSGCGGTTQGLKKSGINIIAAVEIDSIAVETYKYNNPEVMVLNKDICEVSAKDFPEVKLDEYFLLVACPPCQGFSSIRKGGGNDSRNELIFQYQRLINEMKPDFLLMENVSGMTSNKGKKIFDEFINRIEKNYDIIFKVLNAADYGVPQNRKRLVLHGIKKNLAKRNQVVIDLPKPSYSKNGDGNTKQWINSSIILDLPPIEAGEEYSGQFKIYNHVANNLSEINRKRISFIRKGGGSRSALPQELVLNCHKGKRGFTDVYGILDPNKPAVTITGGCMTYSKGRFGHPTQDRALSAREAARLQSFDDDYLFLGTRGQISKQIGNAVPVKLAQASGNYFMKLIKKEFNDRK